MPTLDELRQILERDYLEPVTERTPQTPIVNAITDVEGACVITAGILSPDEESLLGPGAVVEIDYEQMFITAYDQPSDTITFNREYEGTTKVAHLAGAMLRIPTRWPRYNQEQALREALDSLYPPLYSPASIIGTVSTMRFVQLPLDTSRIIRCQWQNGDRWADCQGELFDVHPLDTSFAAVQLEPGVPKGALAQVRYGTKPAVPDSVTDDIVGFLTKWQRLVVVDAAVRLLSGVDIDAVTQEYLTQQIRLERFPVRSGASITQALIRYREYLLEQAETDLIANNPTDVEFSTVEYYG